MFYSKPHDLPYPLTIGPFSWEGPQQREDTTGVDPAVSPPLHLSYSNTGPGELVISPAFSF